jgi:enoyl-CoA hydratase/carnithine racemase
MTLPEVQGPPPLLVEHHLRWMAITLNRPHLINALSLEMIRDIQNALDEAEKDGGLKFVVLRGNGNRGFCAGGDLRSLAEAVRRKDFEKADRFFNQEYALDLRIHRFPKPIIVLADGITMGGGLGLSAGADIVVVTENSRMAMPETKIGFFPDVGASRWLFDKCPGGYPEFLGLTGYELTGAECVRAGLASGLVQAGRLADVRKKLEGFSGRLAINKKEAVMQLWDLIIPFIDPVIPQRPEMDRWVALHFSEKQSLPEIKDSLSHDFLQPSLSLEALQRLEKCSPTALVLTLQLLRFNQKRPLEEVFAVEAGAAHFIIQHPDYLEGIRARLLDRDNHPRWQPSRIEDVPSLEETFLK